MTIGIMNKGKRIVSAIFIGATIALSSSCQQGTQRPISSPEGIDIGNFQIPETWQTHELYHSAFTIAMPNTMELSAPDDNWSHQLNNIGAHREEGIMTFQPKSLNTGTPEHADDHYCRVIINYEKGKSGDYHHYNATEEIDAELRAALLEVVMNNLTSAQQLLTQPTYQWVDIDGTKAIRVKYRRSGNKGNTTACAMYYLFNYNEIALVMTAYREQEAHLWQSDMENVIRTFRWNKRK